MELPIPEQETGDEEARDDEEDVDADEAAAHRQTGVVEDDERDREPAQALDVGPERVDHASLVRLRSFDGIDRQHRPPAVAKLKTSASRRP